MKYSQAQIDIENEVKRGECNVAVEASPGAGKTTTLILCINSIKKTHRTIFLSFSKAIVEELRSRIPGHIKVSTLHGLGCGMVMSYYKGVKVDEDKYFKVAMSLFPHTDNFKLKKENFKNAFWIQDIVRFARMTLTPFTEQDLISMCGYYNLDFTKDVLTKSIKILNDIGKVKIYQY